MHIDVNLMQIDANSTPINANQCKLDADGTKQIGFFDAEGPQHKPRNAHRTFLQTILQTFGIDALGRLV